ncbi:MAG: hypothetical protein K0B05_04385 [Bacteroidales bacterium]|nr:hypothetical protein [Bacteroidales bacterium]
MNCRNNILRCLLLVLSLSGLFGTMLYSQQELMVNVMVRPPYGTKLDLYPELTRVTITYPWSLRATLSVHVKGNNGVDLITAPDYAGPAVDITANVINQFSGNDLSGYFEYQNLISRGIPVRELIESGLPEGSYQICVRVKGPDGGFISPDEPMGCSNFFNIRYGEPPMTVNPQCGARLTQPAVQNIVFSWTPATNAPAWTQYTLKIVELPDSTQNPDAAMLSATEPAFFETTLQGRFSFFYGPAQPLLEKGRIYAWQVIAEEPETEAKFSNNGRSPVCWFKWDPFEPPSISIDAPAEKIVSGGAKLEPVSGLGQIPISVVTGKLNYKFKGALSALAVSQVTTQFSTSQGGIQATGDALQFNVRDVGPENSKPLANVKVSLIVSYVLKGTLNNQTYNGMPVDLNNMRDDEKFLEVFPDHGKVLATATTASDGSFSFTFMNTVQDLGLLDNEAYWKSGGGEFFDMMTGKVYKVFRLLVENRYYCSPDINIKLEPWQALDLGTLVSYVKSYNLKVSTEWDTAMFWNYADGKGKPLDKVKTVLVRKTQVADVPRDEVVYPVSGNLQSFNIYPKNIHTERSGEDGTVTFRNLVQHNPDNHLDRYYVACEPDKNSGLYIFKRRERPFYPMYDKDKKDFPFNSLRYLDTDPGIPATQYEAYGEEITWNSQLQIKTYSLRMALLPDKPRIAGKVETEQVGTRPLSNVTLMLLSNYTKSSNYNVLVRTAKTDAKGYYEFDNLDVELGEYSTVTFTEVTGPDRTLFCTPAGFKGKVFPYGTLLWGRQIIEDILLEPDGLLTGYVTDDNGNAVAADIQVDDLAFTSTTAQFEYDQSAGGGTLPTGLQSTTQSFMPTGMKQVFSIRAPSGKERKLTIIPKNPGYSEETFTVDVPKASSSSAGQEQKQYIVYKMKKRVRFIVAERPSGNIFMATNLKAVPNAEVTLKIPGAEITRTTDPRGTVVFEFDNNGSSFTFNITPPEESDLESATYTINNVKDTKTEVVYPTALLKKATRITGRVSIGNEQLTTPLEGATVYIEMGNGNRLETKTDKSGNYSLTRVPKQPALITVWASKPNSVPNVTSKSSQILLQDQNMLDFVLSYDTEIAIENIFGFQVDLKKKEKQSDGTYLVSGTLINLPANPNFKLSESSQTIPFTNLRIKNSGKNTSAGIPVGIPAVTDFDTDLKDLLLLMNGAYGILQTPSSGAVLKISSENNMGRIMGRAGIMKTSFQYSGNYITFQDNIPIYLTSQPGSTQLSVVTLTTADYPAKKWGIAGSGGTDIQFKLLDFTARADRKTSWLEGDRIGLATVISTNEITGMVPSKLSITLGDLVLRPSMIETVTGTKPLSFKLEKWDFQSTGWSLQQNLKGVLIPQGTIKTGLIDVPVKSVLITPDNFQVGSFQLSDLTFSGVTPLNILTQNNSFGYNPSTGSDLKGHWELRIVGTDGAPGVSITGLPGMEAGAALKFQAFSLLSNGEQKINMGGLQQELIFHKIFKVRPVSFSGGDKYFDMAGIIDLNIPRIKAGSGVIRFSRPASQILFRIFPFNVNFEGPGGVRFLSGNSQDDQNLDASGFTASGFIQDKEGINLKGKLHRTTGGAWLEVDPKGQKMPLGTGASSLSDIEGRMEVQPNINDWTKFTFSGNMSGFNGMQSGLKKTFTVHGSITAENEGLGVKNISGDFGGMNLTYDIKNARLTGNMDIDRHMGAVRIKGAANILVDATGWYFLTGGQLTAPGFGDMAAGMLIGDYRAMAPDVVSTLMQFAYDKRVPSAFRTGISGFFFTGRKDVPIINIPDFNIDLGVLSASLGLTAGLDGRLWMGFDGSGNEYGIGAMAFVHAWFKASSITCTKLSAEARVELGATGTYQTSTGTFTAAGCGSFTIGGSASQCFPTPCWDGICCTGCIGGGISKSIKLDLLFDSKGNTSLDFGFGNCSGQSNLTGN